MYSKILIRLSRLIKLYERTKLNNNYDKKVHFKIKKLYILILFCLTKGTINNR